MKKILLFLVIIYTSLSAFAQPSGYMGKRANFSYSAFVSFPFLYYGKEDFKMVNYTNSFNFEWVVEDRQSIGLRFQPFSTYGYIDGYSSDFVGNYAYGSDYIKESYTLNVYAYSFDYIFYKRGWVAPLGSYNKLSFMYFHYSSKNYLKNNEHIINLEDKVTGYNMALAYTFGKRWIFNDIITLHTSLQLGSYIPLFLINGTKYDNEFRYKSDLKLFGYMMYNFELGVGILL